VMISATKSPRSLYSVTRELDKDLWFLEAHLQS